MSSHALLLTIAGFAWVVIATGVGVHAMNRGRSGFLWGLLTFFTGVLGLLAYALVAGTAANEVTDDDADRYRRCPACATRHDGEPNYCAECGESLDETDDVVTARLLRSGSRRYCSNCKSRVDRDADTCPDCGAVF